MPDFSPNPTLSRAPLWLTRSENLQAQNVALLHGILESHAIWQSVDLQGQGAGVNALGLSLPGHFPCQMGRREFLSVIATDRLIDRFADQLRAAFPGQQVRLIGHSTGALLALAIAARHPDCISDVLVVAGFFSGHPTGRSPLLRAILRIPGLGQLAFRARLRWCLATEARFAAELSALLPASAARPAMTAALHDDLRRSDPATIAALARWLCEAEFAAEFAAITVPVSVLVCGQDTVVPPAHQIELVQRLQQGRAAIFAAGHMPMVEAPVAFNRFLHSWFRQSRPNSARVKPAQGTA